MSLHPLPVIACPGGEPIAETSRGPACRCRVEHSTVDDTHRTSLALFCQRDYRSCPSWQEEKDRIAAKRTQRLVEAHEG